ncbi:DinB family protein [Ornithinimicrobium cavernae]|uniref:DinB family protein n=1 Tax=Ornithinimicrobium cavernae TaxID=2666047 RepID=UPI000D689A1D|nr:DinB family protein [Ornithinimicrobium cavernae]
MTTFGRSDDLEGAEFVGANLRGARFRDSDLTGVVVRGSEIAGIELDSPWLTEGDGSLLVNGVDIVPLVDAALNDRFPGRAQRRASDPEGLRSAWAALEQTWEGTLARVAGMPEGTVEESVAGEWSFSQTLRHLVMATDTWLGKAVLRAEQPYHPLGLANAGAEEDGLDLSPFTTEAPSYPDVLRARSERVRMVRDFLGQVTPAVLAEPRTNPWAPQHAETVLSCLHTILEEEWEHHRYAVRDLDALEARPG